ncbi:Transmembrane and coiled-coil domain-containing protein 4 [Kappamyces sp. JEL0680]|nr:Transmembrane and coiled-coil domain-containing protein 4 [Kappamyces sp. JEL0680]
MAENEALYRIASTISTPADMDANAVEIESNKMKKWATLGIAAIGGGLLVGVTGGLAVPFIAGGLSALGVAGSGVAAFGSVAGAAIVGSVFGVTGAGLASFKMGKHFQNLEEFYFTPVSDVSPGLSYIIAVPGWIKSLDDGPQQWLTLTELNPLLEVMSLQYERRVLVDLTTAAEDFIKSNAISYGIYGVAVAATGTLAVAASLPITALQGLAMLDNPWNLALSKSEQAGIVLARNVIASFVGGNRPVTLVGHGM